MSKAKRLKEQKTKFDAMSKKQLQSELVKTLVCTLMPLLEMVVSKRVEQWMEVIEEGLRS